MRIFLRFRRTQLFHTQRSNIFPQCMIQPLREKRHFFIRYRWIIFRKTNIAQIFRTFRSDKSVKRRIAHGSCNLPCPIWTKIIKNHRIMILDSPHRLTILPYTYRRHHKLVRFSVFIRFLDSSYRIRRRISFAQHHRVIGLLNSIPAFVSIHCIIPPHHGSNGSNADLPHLFFQLRRKFYT